MEDIQTTSPSRIADAPFDDLAGDIILRSNDVDGVNFYTYKLLLTLASPVFKDMFSLPQDESSTRDPGPPVVIMQENADDLRTLLLFCHPGVIPKQPNSFDQLYRMHCIADKYLLDNVKVWLRGCLSTLAEKAPVSVYLLARKLKWKEIARSAVHKSLSHPISELILESHSPLLQSVTAQFLHDLLQYHQRCSDIYRLYMDAQYWAVAWFYGSEPEPGPDIPQFRVTEEECCCKEEVPVTIHDVVHVRSWWSAFLTDCRQVLAKVPVFDNLPLQGFLRKASVEAAKCPRCGPVALEEISDFLPWVKERISYQLDHEVPVPVGSIWGRSPCDHGHSGLSSFRTTLSFIPPANLTRSLN